VRRTGKSGPVQEDEMHCRTLFRNS